MFTGIITAVGQVSSRAHRDGGLELTIAAPYRGLDAGREHRGGRRLPHGAGAGP